VELKVFPSRHVGLDGISEDEEIIRQRPVTSGQINCAGSLQIPLPSSPTLATRSASVALSLIHRHTECRSTADNFPSCRYAHPRFPAGRFFCCGEPFTALHRAIFRHAEFTGHADASPTPPLATSAHHLCSLCPPAPLSCISGISPKNSCTAWGPCHQSSPHHPLLLRRAVQVPMCLSPFPITLNPHPPRALFLTSHSSTPRQIGRLIVSIATSPSCYLLRFLVNRHDQLSQRSAESNHSFLSDHHLRLPPHLHPLASLKLPDHLPPVPRHLPKHARLQVPNPPIHQTNSR